MFESVDWNTVGSTIVLALIAAAVPSTIVFFLNRKNANKKLELSETSVMLSGTDNQIKAYQDLLNRANEAVKSADGIKKDLTSRIEDLESTRQNQIWQITTLRDLFRRVIGRSNITLTPEEQDIFDSTKPSAEIRRLNKSATSN